MMTGVTGGSAGTTGFGINASFLHWAKVARITIDQRISLLALLIFTCLNFNLIDKSTILMKLLKLIIEDLSPFNAISAFLTLIETNMKQKGFLKYPASEY